MDRTRVELPDGHLVNLSPRPSRQGPYKAYRADYKVTPTELSATTPPRYLPRPTDHANASDVSDYTFQESKPTKLPVPRALADSHNDPSNKTPSPSGLPKPTTPVYSVRRPGNQASSSDKSREQGWRKIQDKFEKESPISEKSAQSKESRNDESPISRISYQRSRPTNCTPTNLGSHRAGGVQSGIPSPSTATSSPVQAARSNASISRPVDSLNKWRKQGDQWINMDVTGDTPHKSSRTDTTVDSSPRSHPSVSPVSTEDSSVTDWEDQFVVNMPTAKDPNPPMMTAQQIAEYQKSIERVHREGGQMHQQQQQLSYQQPQAQPQPQAGAASQRQAVNHYYSPDEIGNNRISTIWEESPTKVKEKRHPQNADGSFLGCREISGEKNPDEILTFASPEDASLQPRPLALTSKKNKQKATKEVKSTTSPQIMHRVAETTNLQREQPTTFRNTTPVQCPKQSTMCQDQSCPSNPTEIPRRCSQDSGKKNFQPTNIPHNSTEQPGGLGGGRGDDDVFIITPTITRTMIPTPDKSPSTPKPQGLRRPGGTSPTITAEAIKAVRAKAQMISTPSGLRPGLPKLNAKPTGPTLTTSHTFPLSSISTRFEEQGDKETDRVQDRPPERAAGAASHTIRGFIRTSGLVRSPTDSLATILRNGTESLRTRAESLRTASGSLPRANRKQTPSPQPTLPSRDNSESSRSERSFHSAEDTQAISGNVPTSLPKVVTTDNRPAETGKMESKLSPSGSEASNKPVTKRVTLSEKPPLTHKSDKLPTSTRKISALAKPSKLNKPIKSADPALSERPSVAKAENVKAPPKKDERAKSLPRLRTADEVLEIAELDGLQVGTPKESLQSNITDVYADLGNMHSQDKDDSEGPGVSPLALSLVFNILVVAVTQVNRALRTGAGSPYSKFVVNNTLSMAGHCWGVFSCIYTAVSRYQATGTWPKARSDKAISRFMVDLLQAVVYLFILAFAAMLIGRTAGYVVLVSSWIVWFVRPFAWAFQCVGRALIM
ncbi:uncharacterized protein N7515_007874 [Penicillium bovifimosum]|uniref:NTP binding protein n=1 Tax=Penicillium bovifimosum TaxID=126998 RepID=A0A9W9GMC9_9EURO|nr:uncharacterized protein N7515_007874 [Penicillium bovifimosum]KAJ5124049.1 hypothetical protein N7515_007874 [Penicillium bovifimosum]